MSTETTTATAVTKPTVPRRSLEESTRDRLQSKKKRLEALCTSIEEQSGELITRLESAKSELASVITLLVAYEKVAPAVAA